MCPNRSTKIEGSVATLRITLGKGKLELGPHLKVKKNKKGGFLGGGRKGLYMTGDLNSRGHKALRCWKEKSKHGGGLKTKNSAN